MPYFKKIINGKPKWEQTYPKFVQIGIFMPKKMAQDSVCLLQALKHGFGTIRLEPKAFRLNVGNLTTEYQYAAALRGIPLLKLRRTRSFAMTCLP